jgi:hypothetical protein
LPGTLPFSGRGTGNTSILHDLIIFPISKNARNTNPGSFEVYSHFAGILPTGLIGAFSVTYFPIINLRASNQE